MVKKQTFPVPGCSILPAEVHSGEIIEIDDGLQPYHFYILGYGTVIPLPYFYLTKGDTTQ